MKQKQDEAIRFTILLDNGIELEASAEKEEMEVGPLRHFFDGSEFALIGDTLVAKDRVLSIKVYE